MNDNLLFRNLDVLVIDQKFEPIPNHQYVFGVDWGMYQNDYTIVAVLDVTDSTFVSVEMFKRFGWQAQGTPIMSLYERWKPTDIFVEQGMNNENANELMSKGLPIRMINVTLSKKQSLVFSLASAFERKELKVVNNGLLVHELSTYQIDVMPDGRCMEYHENFGQTNFVLTLALAWYYKSIRKIKTMWVYK